MCKRFYRRENTLYYIIHATRGEPFKDKERTDFPDAHPLYKNDK